MTNRSEAGFSYIDVMIGMMILMIGILGMLSALSASVVQGRGHEQQLLAKEVATSTMESIMSVKETDPSRLGWNAVGNVGSNPDANGVKHGIFLVGNQKVYSDPGPDEVIGTADDTGAVVPNISRQIVITDLCDTDRPSSNCPTPGPYAVKFRNVQVIITYTVGGLQRQETLTTVLADYTVAN